MHKRFIATASILALAACGGGSTGGGTDSNGISTDPITGPEIEQLLTDVQSASGAGAGVLDGIDLTTEEGIGAAFGGGDLALLDNEFAELTPRDLTAAGSASYNGVVLLVDIDASDVFETDFVVEEVTFEEADTDIPTFALLGRSAMNIEFGSTPKVTGGANGFIGLNFETALNTSFENVDFTSEPDLADILAILPTVNVEGSLTYAGGEIIDFDPQTDSPDDEGLQFDVTGNLQLTNALTGSGAQNLQIEGRGLGGVTDTIGAAVLDLTTDGQTLGGLAVGVAE